MTLLLDTHVFLWYISADPRLPATWQANLHDPSDAVYLSVISVWETSIKYHLGKLPLSASQETYLAAQMQRHSIASLPLEEADLSLYSHCTNFIVIRLTGRSSARLLRGV